MRAAILLAFASACQRDGAVILCMNSNCVTPIDVSLDNTMPALRESLQLEWHGRPAFDGIEIDTVWDAVTSRCLFTYLFDTTSNAVEAHEAVAAIAEHVRTAPTDTPFYFKIQGKFRVAPDGRDPTPEELAAHTDCDLSLADVVETAAHDVNRPMTTMFGEEPAQLAVLVQRPGWSIEGRERRLVFKIDETPVGDAHASMIAIDATGVRGTDYATAAELESRGIAVQLWSRHLTPEVMHAIEAIQPTIFDTNDVLTARLWLGPTEDL
jgi:hypothetical protein